MEIEKFNHQECVEKAKIITNKIIYIKKLQLNHIWANKITQPELCIPTQLNELHKNLILAKNILLCIVKYSNKINNIFENVFFSTESSNNESIFKLAHDLVSLSAAMTKKMKNFLEIKTKQFKINKYVVEPLIISHKYFGLFRKNISSLEVSKRLEEIYTNITDFNEFLEIDNHFY